MLRLPVLLVLAACGPTAATDDGSPPGDPDPDTDADTDPDTDADTDADTGPDPDAPTISTADAWCYEHQTGETFIGWDVACQADDPQGVDSLAPGGDLVVSRDGSEVGTFLLACSRDTGQCTTAFREDQTGIACADATAYTFTFTVYDEDGNASAPFAVAGREQ